MNDYIGLKHLSTKKRTIQDFTKHSSTSWPEVLSFLRQRGCSLRGGKSWQQVEQNFHTCLETPSGKI